MPELNDLEKIKKNHPAAFREMGREKEKLFDDLAKKFYDFA